MNMNRFAALATLLTPHGSGIMVAPINAAYNTADAVDITRHVGLIYADPCTVTVPTMILLDNMPGDIAPYR